MSDQKTITLWAKVPFTDARGSYKAGEEITLPNDTDVQQAEVQSLLTYGIASKEKPEAPAKVLTQTKTKPA